ncbi:nuclear transport factor 2 family protein [Streptomyces sp. 8L]|uniref:nuclear transport factor 2 family protein n=1 Tax=Streptomyces sp. 8L TaxID=2877242 RepID=UPI001CD74718|nr:nuclear transport factor 2 family protein [Streptomyces sp. 8L]MCA1220615.1 nuclear transport factor 2 family protein [Streptomyces sp. 8L]
MYTEELPPWLSDAMQGLVSGNLDAWMDAFAEDAVHEFPFAAPGAPRRLEGKEAIRTFMTALSGHLRFGGLSDVRVRETGEDTVIEAEGHHRDGATGAPFDLRYVWIITRRDGRVTRLRDYMGPRRPRTEED